MSLQEYHRKRRFSETSEPRGQRPAGGAHHRFVIQKHAASHLHYDFRLEMGGTLKSWALPKGMPFARGEKRLAIRVEDHPVSYIDFEGSIPRGQYGGGTVMVWDRGTFEPSHPAPAKELAAGKLHFVLHGEKLQGEWYLVRLRDEKQWLLIRGGRSLPRLSKKDDDTSALSGRTMKEIAGGKPAPRAARKRRASPRPITRSGNKTPAATKFVEPMKARLVASPPKDSRDWLYEIKFDGFRTLALKQGDKVRLLSRNEKDFGRRFPEVAGSVAEVSARDAIIDGEIVALDSTGHSSFQLLQAQDIGEKRPPIFFYAFDLLQLNGQDLRREPLERRKALLEKLLKKPRGVIRCSASLKGKVAALLKQAQKLGLEGLIGKRKESIYEPGRRSGAWIKLKLHHEQEMIIGGYTPPQGSRKYLGALLVGYTDRRGLLFAGKVGTGFNQAVLQRLHTRLKAIARKNCPFTNLPEKRPGRFGAGITAGQMKKCHWVKPELICQVRFSEWTRDGKLRQPVFLGLRDDKQPREVIREKPE